MAIAEIPEVNLDTVGLRPFNEFDEANDTWPRGDRPAAIREAAAEFRARFATTENRVHGVRTIDIASAGYPLKFAFGGSAIGAEPLHQHHQPPPGRPVRGLRGSAADARLRADRAGGAGRGPVLRPADRAARRVPLLQGARERSGTTPTRRSRRRASAPRTSTSSASTTSTSRTCASSSAPPSRSRARPRRASRSSRTRS